MLAAAERLRTALKLDPHAADAATLELAICGAMVSAARKALESGRINRALEELKGLGSLGRRLADRRDLEDILEVARAASVAIDRKDYESARRHAMRLGSMAPKMGWARDAARKLEQLDDLVTQLHAGPLGEHAKSFRRGVGAIDPAPAGRRLEETVMLDGRGAGDGLAGLPNQLLLLVDGGGSYLLLRQDRVTLGRAMTSSPADIPMQSNIAERHAEIARIEDDYFMMGSSDLTIDGRLVPRGLLRDGSRVALSSNAKFMFKAPHPQSASAVLEMSGSTRMPLDVRRVVLFKRNATIGFGSSVHVACNHAVHNLVLFERAGRLWIRPQRNGRVDTEAEPVEIGKQMEMFNVSFCLQPWNPVPTTGAIS
jgi:hypothetical protein